MPGPLARLGEEQQMDLHGMDEPPDAAYARRMDPPNQVPGARSDSGAAGEATPPAGDDPATDAAGHAGASDSFGPSAAEDHGFEHAGEPHAQPTTTIIGGPVGAPPADLLPWLIVVALAGVGGLFLGQGELGMFTALAGLFVVAHAADLDRSRELLYRLLAWVVPVTGLFLFVSLGVVLLTGGSWSFSDMSLRIVGPAQAVGLAIALLGALSSVALAFPAIAGAVGRWWFHTTDSSHVLRLATRMTILAALLYVPASVAFRNLVGELSSSSQSLVGPGSLWGNLFGLALLALGGVGFRVRRGLRDTLARLGLDAIAPAHWLLVGLGVVAMMALNGGAEWVQRTWLPALWQNDQAVTQLITRGLTHSDAVLLGISAGVGEELAIRGALQPRLGILRTSAVFAALHVQYSWFGVLVIFMLGVLLGTLRRRTSTTVAVLVHMLYDTLAVIFAPQ
jgi:membrane protease YdiL (CAAX protease family)